MAKKKKFRVEVQRYEVNSYYVDVVAGSESEAAFAAKEKCKISEPGPGSWAGGYCYWFECSTDNAKERK